MKYFGARHRLRIQIGLFDVLGIASLMDQDAPAIPYPSSLVHLLDELARIDVLVRAAVVRARRIVGDDAFRGLAISEADIDTLLDRSIGQPHWLSAPSLPHVGAILEEKRAQIDERRGLTRAAGISLRLDELARRFGLTAFDVDVLLVALLPEIDTRYERIFGYLHDDVTQKQPRVDVVLGLLCSSLEGRFSARTRFAPAAPLLRHELVHLFSPTPRNTTPLLSCALKVDERILEYLHGSDDIEPSLARWVGKVSSARSLDDLLLPREQKEQLAKFVVPPRTHDLVVYLQAPPGNGKRTLAEALTSSVGKTLLVVQGQRFVSLTPETARSALHRVVREARLSESILYWDQFDTLVNETHEPLRQALLEALEELPGPTFLAGSVAWEPVDALRGRRFLRIVLTTPDAADQMTLWKTALGGNDGFEATVDFEGLVRRYRLGGGQIRDAAAMARATAAFRSPDEPRVTMADLSAACRFHTNRHMSSLAHKVEATSTWQDLVLPHDRLAILREICNHVRYRDVVMETWGFGRKLTSGRGSSLMFTGPPGTGKTMAAGVMARELDLDLYQVDLSGVVSKYIGETEKHLARIFTEAENSRAILFFDEADALFGKRTEVKDAHDRFANIETSYLLQRIESYTGLIILATNFSKNVDEAFVRRIQFVIEFSLPEENERRAIWERIWPFGVPRAPDLDLEFMARRFEIAGAHIRNIALAAAYLAASEHSVVTQKHLLRATRREYQKMGKVVDDGHFLHRP